MAKVVKQKYTKSDGSKAIYSYLIPVPKNIMEASDINIDKEIKIEIQKGKLIISN